MNEILLTGGTGQVGTALQRLIWPNGVKLVAPAREELDLSKPATVAGYMQAHAFSLVINCAAFTAVDKCESDVLAAWTANALAPAALAHASAQAKIPMLHISTDYVFDGAKPSPYIETDAIAPISVYGASKAGGELAVRSANARHVILRTSWVVSATGNNFVKTMLRVGAERPLMRVVADQHGAPTSADDLAQAIATIARRLLSDADCPFGTYQFSNAGQTTWHGFASEIFAQSARRGGPNPQLEAISTAEYPLPARRPASSLLSTAKFTRDFGLVPRPWPEALSDIIAQLLPVKLLNGA